MLARLVDRLIEAFSPARGLQRIAARATLDQINAVVGSQGGYEAGKLNRLTRLIQNLHDNAVPAGQLDRMTAHARDLYRNNPHARKIVRVIETKTIGRGMNPQPQAARPDRTADVAFRRRAKQVWSAWLAQSDARGLPGHGGQHFTDQCKSALRTVIRAGNLLYRLRPLSESERARRGLLLPVVLQLIDGDRLDQTITESDAGNRVWNGVELAGDGTVAAYHLHPFHPSDPQYAYTARETQRVNARDVAHLFVADDVDQIVGSTWFAAALNPTRDVGDYTYNELKAAAMAACVVAAVERTNPGVGQNIGVQNAAGPLTDEHGNRITRLQPGMILDGVKITTHNPGRPNANAEAFTQHLLRVISTAVPGVKGSTLTGDYRRSSFASERSADNEIWPEIEGVQQWFGFSFLQPCYEAVIETAVLSGYFDDVIRAAEYMARRRELLPCEWQGPVARSINPADDAEAAALRIRNGTSSPQIEAAKEGRNWLELQDQIKEYVEHVYGMGLPEKIAEQLILQVLGIGSDVDSSAATSAEPATAAEGTVDEDEDEDDDLPGGRLGGFLLEAHA